LAQELNGYTGTWCADILSRLIRKKTISGKKLLIGEGVAGKTEFFSGNEGEWSLGSVNDFMGSGRVTAHVCM
jgi:hypothetical protein